MKFKGYSLSNFKNKPNSMIIMEYTSNIVLYKLLSYYDRDLLSIILHKRENKKENNIFSNWNETKKLINIYRIATAISYQHRYQSHNIISKTIWFWPNRGVENQKNRWIFSTRNFITFKKQKIKRCLCFFNSYVCNYEPEKKTDIWWNCNRA